MWQPSAILNLLNFDTLSLDRLLEQICVQISLKSYDSRLRNSDKTIFKMAVFRFIVFLLTSSYCFWVLYVVFLNIMLNFQLNLFYTF